MESKGLSLDKAKPIIFISHRSTDKEVANMLAKFLYATGIPSDTVFCSSLPGNDVKKRISDEVKAALKASAVNIVILSQDYYQSAYCLQEAGVIWYRDDVPVVLVALKEINENNIYGFFDKNDILRRLDKDEDIWEIYEDVSKAVSAPYRRLGAIAKETAELMEQYAEFLKKRPAPETEPAVLTTDDTESKAVSTSHRRISVTALKSAKPMKRYADSQKTRETPKTEPATSSPDDAASNAVLDVSGNQNTEMTPIMTLQDAIISGHITDDERVVLYYLLEKSVRKASKDNIAHWLFRDEIYGVSVDNAFDMLLTFKCITFTDEKLELEINTFKEFILNKTSILSILKEGVDKHKKLASDTFKKLWENGGMSSTMMKLFIAYIIDKKITTFEDSMHDDSLIRSIKDWERKNSLNPILSKKYKDCISNFYRNGLVYHQLNGIYGAYYLHPSLEELLFNNSRSYRAYLDECKQWNRKRYLQGLPK